jgi:hypothetical protein
VDLGGSSPSSSTRYLSIFRYISVSSGNVNDRFSGTRSIKAGEGAVVEVNLETPAYQRGRSQAEIGRRRPAR